MNTIHYCGISVPFQAQTQTTNQKLLLIHMLTSVNRNTLTIFTTIYSEWVSAVTYFIFKY